MYVCMYVSLEICVFAYVCISTFCVCVYITKFMHMKFRTLIFMFFGPAIYFKIPFVKLVDFIAGGAMRDHGH